MPSIEHTALFEYLLDPPRDFCGCVTPSRYETPAKRVVFDPLLQVVLPEIVLVVEPQFLEAGTRYIGQLEFELLGGAACLASFSDILHSRSRCLYHLIMGSAPSINVLITESDSEVIHQL